MIAILHFTLETLYTLRFGQTVAGYLPDLIAVSLLVVGATLTLKDFNAIGILCGFLSALQIMGMDDLMM